MRVVNSYAAASLLVPVNDVSRVDLPTDGNPTSPIRVSPDLLTSKPRPASFDPDDFPPGPLINSDFSLASFALRVPVFFHWRERGVA